MRSPVMRFFLPLLMIFLLVSCSGEKNLKPQAETEDVKIEEKAPESSFEKEIQAVKTMLKENRFQDAEQALNAILAKRPEHIEVNHLLANLYYQKKDYQQSLNLYEKLIGLGEKKADVFFQVGQNYTQLKNYYSALASYKQAIALDPMLTEAYLKVGDIYLEWKNTDEASRWYERAIKTEQKAAQVYYHLAKMNFEMVQYPKALEQLNQVFEIDEAHLEGRILELKILQNTGKNDLLPEKAKNFVEAFPDNAEGYLFLGKLFLDLRQLKVSLSHYQKALSLAPQSPASHNGMGNYYFDLKDYKKAGEFYAKALALSPNYAHAFYNIGLVEWKLKNYEKARENFLKAYEINHWFKDALLFSAICSAQIGKEEDSLRELVRFYEKDALLYAGYLKNQEYAVPMGQILQSFWKFYDRTSSFDRGFFVCLVDSRDKVITILTRETRPEAFFLLSRIYLMNKAPDKAKEAFLKYLTAGAVQRETILLDSTFNDFKTQEWFLEALEKSGK